MNERTEAVLSRVGSQDVGVIPLETITSMSGLELLKKMLAGELPGPPIAKTLSFTLWEAEEGRVVFRGTPNADHLNPLGAIHGGWTATIMDSALACVVQTSLAKGEAYTTTEFKVNLIRPLLPDMGEVACEALIVSRGRTVAVSEARLRDEKGRILAFGTETCSIFPVERLARG
jgi:uncharacterized protein (TIGR00369 family)